MEVLRDVICTMESRSSAEDPDPARSGDFFACQIRYFLTEAIPDPDPTGNNW